MTELVVGAPACDRAWILPTYFEYVEKACADAGMSPEYVFCVPAWDKTTRDEILSFASTSGRAVDIIQTKEPVRSDVRDWRSNGPRYHHMVELRNLLLARVRTIAPLFFWSLDTDILPAPDCLSRMVESLVRFAAVGSRTYMSPPPLRNVPSYAQLKGDGLTGRFDAEAGCFPVDVIMASKLMAPDAYWTDYEFQLHGEDVGWSIACKKAGLKLGWNAAAVGKHVMAPRFLDQIDPRVGF